jgi:hypothetical protein
VRLPPDPHDSEDAHTKAVEQLAEARQRQRELSERADAAEGTSGEVQAAEDLERARHRVAAREAWVVWTERGI